MNNSRLLTVYALLIIAALFINLHSDILVPLNKPFSEFPTRHRDWHMLSQSSFSEKVLDFLKPTDYLDREYVNDKGRYAHLYIGYHGGGKGAGSIHSPRHCLPGSGWYLEKEKKLVVDLGGEKINLVQAVYQNGETKEVFLYWYQVKGRYLTDEYALKLTEILNSILYRRRDSAFVRISLPFELGEEEAFSTGIGFIRDFHLIIDDFLPR